MENIFSSSFFKYNFFFIINFQSPATEIKQSLGFHRETHHFCLQGKNKWSTSCSIKFVFISFYFITIGFDFFFIHFNSKIFFWLRYNEFSICCRVIHNRRKFDNFQRRLWFNLHKNGTFSSFFCIFFLLILFGFSFRVRVFSTLTSFKFF